MDWKAIHKSARDNMIREYLRARRLHSAWLKAYYRKRALENAKEWREYREPA